MVLLGPSPKTWGRCCWLATVFALTSVSLALKDDDHLFAQLRSFVHTAGGVVDVKLVTEPGELRGLAAARNFKKGDAVVLLPPGTYLTENEASAPWKEARSKMHSLRGPVFVGTLLREDRYRRNQTPFVHRQGWVPKAFQWISKQGEASNMAQQAVDFVDAYLSMLPVQPKFKAEAALWPALSDEVGYSSPVSLLSKDERKHRKHQHRLLAKFGGTMFEDLAMDASKNEWERAYYLISSRVWTAGGVGVILPVIDLLNHQPHGNVEFAGCTEEFHDLGTSRRRVGRHCLLKAAEDIPKDTVLHISYGLFSNVQLLLKYSFAFPDNPILAALPQVPGGLNTGKVTLNDDLLKRFNCSESVFVSPMLVNDSWLGRLTSILPDHISHIDLFRCMWLHRLADSGASQRELEITSNAGTVGPGPNATRASRMAAEEAAREVAARCSYAAQRISRREMEGVDETSSDQTSRNLAAALLSQSLAAQRCADVYTASWKSIRKDMGEKEDL